MVFSSITFLFYFLPAFLLAYLALPRWRNGILLASSLVFYAWGETFYVAVMIATIIFNYFFGIWIERTRLNGGSRMAIGVAITINLAMLVFFKYGNFIARNANTLLVIMGRPTIDVPNIHLPLGISFFTFQALSYVIDVYRGHVKAQARFFNYALYKSLFPQLIAGPIVRYKSIADELEHRTITWSGFTCGIHLFVWGLASKVLLANTMAVPADAIFATPPEDLSSTATWLGVFCYTFQIYFDFAGYSTMAIGLGLMMGFHFCENFNRPYVSQSITEFWRRWHISLSTWFRDYLYIPLGGNRAGRASTYRNLIIVFLLCGMWHGAKWTFIIWGAYHGVFLILERRWPSILQRMPRVLRHVYTLLAVMVGWVVFRCDSFRQTLDFLGVMFGTKTGGGLQPAALFLSPAIIIALTVSILSVLVDWSGTRLTPPLRGDHREPAPLSLAHGAVTAALFALATMSLAAGTHNPFIYYRF